MAMVYDALGSKVTVVEFSPTYAWHGPLPGSSIGAPHLKEIREYIDQHELAAIEPDKKGLVCKFEALDEKMAKKYPNQTPLTVSSYRLGVVRMVN